MLKKFKITISIVVIITIISSLIIHSPLSAFAAYEVTITNVPAKCDEGRVVLIDEESSYDKPPLVDIDSENGTAKVFGLLKGGYYTVYFGMGKEEFGEANFFISDKGEIYNYVRDFDENYELIYIKDELPAESIEFEEYNNINIIDISGDIMVEVIGVPTEAKKIYVYFEAEKEGYNTYQSENELYELADNIEGSTVTFKFGYSGKYKIYFYDDNDKENEKELGYALFRLYENGKIEILDSDIYAENGIEANEVTFINSKDESPTEPLETTPVTTVTDTETITTVVTSASTTSEISATTANTTIVTATTETSVNTTLTTTVTSEAIIMRGDVNGDGKVNSRDVVPLTRFVAGGWNVEINEKAADVNGDGKINSRDIAHLTRYIAGGWGIVLEN